MNILKLHELIFFASKNGGQFASALGGQFNRRTHFKTLQPFSASFSNINSKKCTIKYVEAIKAVERTFNKIDLNDVTFIIPFRMDSLDRSFNLDTTARFLLKHFSTSILVIECDEFSKVNHRKFDDRIQFHFIHSTSEYFEKSRCISFGMKLSRTKFVALFGTDYICHPNQIIDCVAKLRQGDYSFCHPFSKEIIHIDRATHKIIKDSLDIGKFNESISDYKQEIKLYSGCLFVNKQDYKKCGLENTRIIDFRRINEERNKRLRILGYTIGAVNGPLYHLSHYHLEDEILSNPVCQTNDTKEILKICSYSKRSLQNYVSSWNLSQVQV